MAEALELCKLEHLPLHHAPSRNRQWHIYTVEERAGRGTVIKRLYLRGRIHQIGNTPEFLTASYRGTAADLAAAVVDEIGGTLSRCLEELLRVQHGEDGDGATSIDWSHIFLSLLPSVDIGEDATGSVVAALRSACARWTNRLAGDLRTASVAQIELRICAAGEAAPWRVIASLPTGQEAGDEHVDVYREERSPGGLRYRAVSQPPGALHGRPVLQPYGALSALQQKRLLARRHGTTYCYDFPAVFANALREIWTERAVAGEPCSTPPPGALVEAAELGFDGQDSHASPYAWKLRRLPEGSERLAVGMVAWTMTVRSPEAPDGRSLVAIANDITHHFGAFGPKEDALFRSAVEHALDHRLPVVYIAANSGARVGLATDVGEKLKVQCAQAGTRFTCDGFLCRSSGRRPKTLSEDLLTCTWRTPITSS